MGWAQNAWLWFPHKERDLAPNIQPCRKAVSSHAYFTWRGYALPFFQGCNRPCGQLQHCQPLLWWVKVERFPPQPVYNDSACTCIGMRLEPHGETSRGAAGGQLEWVLCPIAAQLCPKKTEHRAGSRAACELLTLSEFSPEALDLSLLCWCISHSEPCLTFLCLSVHTDETFCKTSISRKKHFPPFLSPPNRPMQNYWEGLSVKMCAREQAHPALSNSAILKPEAPGSPAWLPIFANTAF